ncbi:hypothetical protein J4G48_0040220 [Bradyrhizobium barranii subsp. apii]|uniref:hypothetical protein n=1 Tax=Bradyrhizobium barranii TaxID=2992140 RepID=UPI001AA17ED2|nr:hypothetical protein [Bradyrhizobium barranii]UPT95384.1 hypothetical protein J4G48_0040220 [Bradyrhizobium barranii subsp. apii]
MAKAKDETAGLPAVDPAKTYRVKLARAIEVVPGIWARPFDHDVTIQGADIPTHGDAIVSYEEV